MNKIREEIALILSRLPSEESHNILSKQQIAESIHKQYLTWMRFHLPDMESGWTLEQCLEEIERMFKEE